MDSLRDMFKEKAPGHIGKGQITRERHQAIRQRLLGLLICDNTAEFPCCSGIRKLRPTGYAVVYLKVAGNNRNAISHAAPVCGGFGLVNREGALVTILDDSAQRQEKCSAVFVF